MYLNKVGFGHFVHFGAIPEDINHVEAYAIPEPLKVRMITKPHPYTNILKELQKCLFNSFKRYESCRPCYDPDYNLNQLGEIREGEFYLSGDYSNATDGINFSISQRAIDCIVRSLERRNMNYLADVVRLEGGEHTVNYPKWTQIHPIRQINGQLMGSLLSFPILCYVNWFICLKALYPDQPLTEDHKEKGAVLIHGDDVLMKATEEQINDWENLAKKVGFGLSIGKCYKSPVWGSIDSRLYYKGKRTVTGGFKSAGGQYSSCVSNLLTSGFPKGLIVSFYKDYLNTTCRSIDLPISLGGLIQRGPDLIQRCRDIQNIYSVTSDSQRTGQCIRRKESLAVASLIRNYLPKRDHVKGLIWFPTGYLDLLVPDKHGKPRIQKFDFDYLLRSVCKNKKFTDVRREFKYEKDMSTGEDDPFCRSFEKKLVRISKVISQMNINWEVTLKCMALTFKQRPSLVKKRLIAIEEKYALAFEKAFLQTVFQYYNVKD